MRRYGARTISASADGTIPGSSSRTMFNEGVAAPDPRFTMANERTFLAWNRTALALIAGGLAVEQFLNTGRVARLAIALPLILLGAILAAASYGRWRNNELAMGRGETLPPSRMPAMIAFCLALFSGAALVLAVVHAL
jgi:inner membrane protein YidH